MKYTKKNLKRLLADATGSKWYLLQLIKINDCNANCSACGISERIVSLECGHKVSAANGGKFILSNLQIMCRRCNITQGKINFDTNKLTLKKPFYQKNCIWNQNVFRIILKIEMQVVDI